MPFVAQTIASVLAQRYENLEYIVVDGGSTDGTLDIIKKKQHGIQRWISEKDGGIADAFNKGLGLSSGDYVLFLNADDALSNAEAVSNLVQHAVANGCPAFVYGDCNVLERESGRTLYRAVIEFTRNGLLRGRMPPHPSLLTKRSYFEKYGQFDTQFKVAMDFEWFLRGIRSEQIVHAPILVTNVRSGGVSTQHPRIAIEEIIRALHKNGYLSSKLKVWGLRTYFSGRAAAKMVIERLGIRSGHAHIKSK